MPNALIVDDSKTARYALRQLLDRQRISSDMVESAEQALEYLEERKPDFIFMDHMMPGMDGFEAVKMIKANPATSAIPIVMYTSTQGGVYFGQARALGAADVIAKPATARDLEDVLERLANQARRAQPGTVAVAALDEAANQDDVAVPLVASATGPVSSVVQPQQTARSASGPAPSTPAPAAEPSSGPRSWRSSGWAAAAVIALIGVIVLTALYLEARAANRELERRWEAALAGLQWGVNQSQAYPYGEAPLSGERLIQLQELLVYLRSAGFAGVVRVESHVGEYCLVQASSDGPWVPAAGDMPITECEALGQSEAESLRMSQQASNAFERFVERTPLLDEGVIEVEIVSRGAREPAVPYPSSAAISADAWNTIAQQNNRVVFELEAH